MTKSRSTPCELKIQEHRKTFLRKKELTCFRECEKLEKSVMTILVNFFQKIDGDCPSAGLVGAPHRGRFIRGGGGLGHGDSRNVPLSLMMTNRTSSEFLDSGISVLSGATPTVISATQPPPTLPYERTDLRYKIIPNPTYMQIKTLKP